MARVLALLWLLAAMVACAAACAAPPGSCDVAQCALYKTPDYNDFADGTWDQSAVASWNKSDAFRRLAYYLGKYTLLAKEADKNTDGAPMVNYERFDIEDGSKAGTKQYAYNIGSMQLSACCDYCRTTSNCVSFQFSPVISSNKFTGAGTCYLLTGGTTQGLPYSGSSSVQASATRKTIKPTFVIAACNPIIKNDPHFTGARGTKFDFNGELDKSFCLVTDKQVQLNALLSGYKSSEGKGIRSWIRELGLLWRDSASDSHSLRLVARSGKEQQRGAGFVARAVLDGEELQMPAVAGESVSHGLLTLEYEGEGATGPYAVDRFRLRVDGLVDLSLTLRVAHPKLQTPQDAMVHFNIVFNSIAISDSVHGVVGQTYRPGKAQQAKALKYSELAQLLHAPVQADGVSGKGFLDGFVADYRTSNILSPDCKFSSFAT